MKDRTESGLPLQNQRIHSDPTILENEIGNGLFSVKKYQLQE